MTVQQLIEILQRNFSPGQQVVIAAPISKTLITTKTVGDVGEVSLGRAKGISYPVLGGLGPDVCVLWPSNKIA